MDTTKMCRTYVTRTIFLLSMAAVLLVSALDSHAHSDHAHSDHAHSGHAHSDHEHSDHRHSRSRSSITLATKDTTKIPIIHEEHSLNSEAETTETPTDSSISDDHHHHHQNDSATHDQENVMDRDTNNEMHDVHDMAHHEMMLKDRVSSDEEYLLKDTTTKKNVEGRSIGPQIPETIHDNHHSMDHTNHDMHHKNHDMHTKSHDMNHGGHDMNHGGHGMPMPTNSTMPMDHMMVFHFGIHQVVLFSEWSISTLGGMIGSVIGIILLGWFYEGLKYFREHLFKQYVSSMQFSTVAVTEESGRVAEVHKINRPRRMSSAHAMQTCLHVVQIIISYFLMLIFMTFNVWLCIAVVVGSALGFFTFGWKKATVVDITEHCH